MEFIESSIIGNPYMFTGRRFDSETGLYYYRAIYYDPYIGRFLQTDPVFYTDWLNLYTYVRNNPVNWTDPTGLKIVVEGDGVAVGQAGSYLYESSAFIDTFTYLSDRPETYIIRTNTNGYVDYTPSTNTVRWDPTSALETTSGGTQSPGQTT